MISLFLFTGCSKTQVVIKDTLEEPITHEIYKSDDKPTTNVLSICNSVGNIKISNSNTDNLKVTANLVQTKEIKDLDKKLNNILIKPQIENSITLYEPLYKQAQSSNFWEWISANLNTNGIRVDFNIEIPSTIKEVRVYNSVGNIEMQNISAKIYAQTAVGYISGIGLNPLDSSIFKVDVSSNKDSAINLDFSSIDNLNNLTAASDIGKVLLNLPKDSTYTHKEVDAKDLNLDYPSSTNPKEFFNYCKDKGLKPFIPLAPKTDKTVISTATALGKVSIKTN